MIQSPVIFDRGHSRRSMARSSCNRGSGHFLSDWNLDVLIDRLNDIKRQYHRALLIGCRNSANTLSKLKQSGKIEHLIICDNIFDQYTSVCIDEERLPFKPGSFDLIISPFSLHKINDVPGALIQIKNLLKPDGLFLGAFPGESTLLELRQSFLEAEMTLRNGVRMRVHPCIDKQQAAALMQRAAFTLPVVDAEKITVTYDNAFSLMKDLKNLGETNILAARLKGLTGRGLMLAMAKYYQDHFQEPDGRIYATFEMLFLSGWSPHESQQKPLRPGTAQSRLAAALGTEEISTGEIAAS